MQDDCHNESVFLFNDTATTESYTYWHTLSLHDALPISPFDLARTVAAGMGAGGRIVNITSIAGQIARSGDAAYTMAKGGLDALTRALAAELGGRGITVNAVAPGYFATEANEEMTADPAVADHLARRTSLGRWGRRSEGSRVGKGGVSTCISWWTP